MPLESWTYCSIRTVTPKRVRFVCFKVQILVVLTLATLISLSTCLTKFSRSRFRTTGLVVDETISWACSRARVFLTPSQPSWPTWALRVRSAPKASFLFSHSYMMLLTTSASPSCNVSSRVALSFSVRWSVTISYSPFKSGPTHLEVACLPLAW